MNVAECMYKKVQFGLLMQERAKIKVKVNFEFQAQDLLSGGLGPGALRPSIRPYSFIIIHTINKVLVSPPPCRFFYALPKNNSNGISGFIYMLHCCMVKSSCIKMLYPHKYNNIASIGFYFKSWLVNRVYWKSVKQKLFLFKSIKKKNIFYSPICFYLFVNSW